MRLRPYQVEDVQAVIDAHQKHQCVIGRAATGLGKAVELAAIALHYSQYGRVMLLVDMDRLARQLADTIEVFTGDRPGIEIAGEEARNGGFLRGTDRIIVSTVQSQYSGPEGQERFRKFKPDEFAALLLDETETFLAPTARSVVEWYRSNAALRVYGCTATPFRTDGKAMAELFDAVAFDRDILWGIDQGFLVPARQAFVRVNVDFGTLSVKKNEAGEKDYSDEAIAALINNDETSIELAKGIINVVEDRKSIVVCPNVEVAKAVTHYLEGEKSGCARCVYGALPDREKDDMFTRFARSEFQFLVSVMLLTKGFDQPDVRAVVNCRKTRSKRLYTQILGRGTRVLKGLINDIETAEDRKAAIAASAKPDMLMVNMVGVDDDVRDMTVLDILGEKADPKALERAKRNMLEDSREDAEAEFEAGRELEKAEEQEREDKIAKARKLVKVKADVQVRYENDLRAGGGNFGGHSHLPEKTLANLRRNKVPEDMIARFTVAQAKELSGKLSWRWKAGLCSFAQGRVLQRAGYRKEEISVMTRDQASQAIDKLKSNGWKRQEQAA